uniref:Uncharacterized protein n=1 Tax=Romanomermis culicivorax TaxID=13658 RepID=A0A915J221_ROMCU
MQIVCATGRPLCRFACRLPNHNIASNRVPNIPRPSKLTYRRYLFSVKHKTTLHLELPVVTGEQCTNYAPNIADVDMKLNQMANDIQRLKQTSNVMISGNTG